MKRYTGNRLAAICSRSIVFLWLSFSCVAFADDLPRRGYVGIQAAPVPEEMRAQLALAPAQGILVKGVLPSGPAQEAGILANDVILKVNDINITDPVQFTQVVKSYHGGDKLQIALLRNRQPFVKTLLIKPFPYETSPDYEILYKSVTVDNARRRVIITKPKAAGRHPAIFFVGGIGCYSLDNLPPSSPYGKIFSALTQKGFVTMRVEKTGMGDSEGVSCGSPQADLRMEVRGYVAGLRALKSYDFVDSGNIFIFGHSIGGIVGPLVAQEVPVKGLIVAETVGTSWFEYLLENRRRQYVISGLPYDEIEKLARQHESCIHRLYIEKQSIEQIVKDSPQCAELIQAPAPYTYLQQIGDINLAEMWKSIDLPVLVIYGTSDPATSAEEHQYLTNVINSYHPGRAKFVRVENMDHVFERFASMRESLAKTAPGEFQPALLDEIQRWLMGALQG